MNFSFGSVPEIAASSAMILALVALVIQAGAVIYMAVGMFLSDYDDRAEDARDLLTAGKSMRNAALFVLVLLFMIANKKIGTGAWTVMQAIGDVCRVYMLGSLGLLLAAGFITALGVLRRRKEVPVKRTTTAIWNASLLGLLVSGALAYLFS